MIKALEIKAILFDLDGTLIPEYSADNKALSEACILASALRIDPQKLAELVVEEARKLFYTDLAYSFTQRIGGGSKNALCSDFQVKNSKSLRLKKLAETYRIHVWFNALKKSGCANIKFAQFLAKSYIEIRSTYYQLFPGTEKLLSKLSATYKMGIITNGFGDLQQKKIRVSGADKYIPHHIISGNIGIGKPSTEIFIEALKQLDSKPENTLMVGDSLENDIQGAIALGFQTILVTENRVSKALDRLLSSG